MLYHKLTPFPTKQSYGQKKKGAENFVLAKPLYH